MFANPGTTIGVTVDELSAPPDFTQADIQPLISHVAVDLGVKDGVQYSVSFQPLTIGALTGSVGTVTAPGSTTIILIGVVTDGTHIVVVQTTYFPSTSQADIQQAAQMVASIRPTT